MSQTLDAVQPVAGDVAVGASVESNIADLAVDRHVRAGHGADTALRWIGRDRDDLDDPLDISYSMLANRSARFAGALRHHGAVPGTAVATLLGRVPDLYIAAIGTWKARCVFAALSPSSGPETVAEHLLVGRVAVLVTSPALFRRAVVPVLDRLPDLRLVLICGASEDQSARSAVGHGIEVMSCGAFLCDSADDVAGETTDPEEPATLHFTSEPAHPPSAFVRGHGAADADQRATRLALDLGPGDTYWCTTEPDWMAGIIGALTMPAMSIVDEGDFDAARWRHILRHQHVDVLQTSPSELDRFRRAVGDDDATGFDVRVVATVGDPLDAATATWARSFFGAPVLTTTLQAGSPYLDGPR